MICTKCHKEFIEPSALSREDNSPICSLCGTKEALDAAVQAGAMKQEVADEIIDFIKTKNERLR